MIITATQANISIIAYSLLHVTLSCETVVLVTLKKKQLRMRNKMHCFPGSIGTRFLKRTVSAVLSRDAMKVLS